MEIDEKERRRRLEHFETVFRNAKMKITPQRLEVFRVVASTGDHPDAETVHERVRERMPTISLDTVYRTLWLLQDLGLVATLGASQKRARFDANLEHHHHFVCLRCGLTRDFRSETLDGLDPSKSTSAFGEVRSTHVEARGLCHTCAARKED